MCSAPHKAALKSIHASGPADFALARPFLSSMHWMLQAAGIGTDGVGGGLRVSGLAMVYASVFRVWLEDDDAGLARTMAAFDRRLRRGERTVRNVEQAGSVIQRFATDAPGFLRSVLRGDPKPEPKPGPETSYRLASVAYSAGLHLGTRPASSAFSMSSALGLSRAIQVSRSRRSCVCATGLGCLPAAGARWSDRVPQRGPKP